jgi:hypothetical protein
MKKVVMSLLVVSLFFSELCFMGTQAMATIDLMANRQLVILADTQLLDDYRKPNSIYLAK